MKNYLFIVEKTHTGFSAYSNDFEKFPVGTTGTSISELKANILDDDMFIGLTEKLHDNRANDRHIS